MMAAAPLSVRPARDLDALLSILPEPIVAIGQDGRVLVANAAAREAFGDDVASASALFATPADWPALADRLDADGVVRGHHALLRQRDGQSASVQLSACRVGAGDEAATVLAIAPQRQAAEPDPVVTTAMARMAQGLAVFDRDLRLVGCNSRFGELLALPEHLLQSGRSHLTDHVRFRARRGDFGAVDVDRVIEERVRDLSGKSPSVRVRRLPDGTWLQVNGNPLPGGGVVLTLTEVTALKNAETALRAARDEVARAKRQLTEAVEAISEGFVLYDADDRLVLFNSRYRDEYSFGRESLIPGTRFEDILRQGVASGYVPENYDREQWIRERLERHRNPAPPYLVQRPDGRWVRITEYRTQEGGIVGVRTDVTDLKERELALHENQQLLRAVIDAVPAVINVKDLESRYVLMNRFQAELYGAAPDEAIGKTSADLVGSDYGGRSREFDLEVIRTGRPLPFAEREFTDVAGKAHTWFTAKMPLNDDDGTVRGVVTVALEITALKNTERARANLARYFPPNMIDLLASVDEPFGPARLQPVAVVFADIIGFTRICAEEPPEQVFGLLRAFQNRMASQVFACEGTLDKYTGDGMMATFGTPSSGPRDATNALRCARGMLRMMHEWNRELAEAGHAAIRIAIGIHYGPALLGNIGDERRLEFAVIGDTVNVASRLEKLARPLEAAVVVSDAVVDAVGRENPAGSDALAGFVPREPQPIRGRDGRIPVWVLPLSEA